MRILFLDVNLRYLNPTRSLMPRMISHIGEMSVFGPGYVSSDMLAGGLNAYIDKHGPFDVVVATEHILFSGDPSGAAPIGPYLRNYVVNFPHDDFNRRQRILSEFQQLDCIKVASLMESDFYNFTDVYVQTIRNTDLSFGLFGHQFIRHTSDLHFLSRELFCQYANDNWHEFITQVPAHFVPIPHFIADSEFDYTALAHRQGGWCVPGIPYAARRRARQVLGATGASLVRSPFPWASTLMKLRLRTLAHPMFLACYQESFREEIRRSRFAYTCGSVLGYAIRKFFEIPAMGTVLSCQPCNAFKELGFIDGVNCFAVTPEKLPELDRTLLANLDVAQRVADAGRQLISQFHTLGVRASQLKIALEAALNKNWHGAEWETGTMKLLPKVMNQDNYS